MNDRELQGQDILRRIHETERNADRILREAEAGARSMREQAQSKADEILRVKKQECAQRRELLLAQRLEETRQDAERIVEEAREKARRFKADAETKIPEVVEQLLKRLLPD